jgi:hypothetical protein
MVLCPLTHCPVVGVLAFFAVRNFCVFRIDSVTMTTMRGLSGSPVQGFQQNSLNAAAASSISSGIIIPSIIRSIIRIHMGAGM